MAWTWVSRGLVGTSSSGDITPGLPSGTQENDLIVAFISIRGTINYTVPSGWTLIGQESSGNTLNNSTSSASGCMLAYIIRGASAPSTTFTRTGGAFSYAVLLAYRNNNPILYNTFASVTMSTSSSTLSMSGLTSSGNNPLLVMVTAGARNVVNCGSADAVTDPTVASPNHSTVEVISSADPTINTWLNRSFHHTSGFNGLTQFTHDGLMTQARATGDITVFCGQAALHSNMVASFTEESVTVEEVDSTLSISAGNTNLASSLILSSLSLLTPLSDVVAAYSSLAGILSVDAINALDTESAQVFSGLVAASSSQSLAMDRYIDSVAYSPINFNAGVVKTGLADSLSTTDIPVISEALATGLASRLAELTVDQINQLDATGTGVLLKAVLVAQLAGLTTASTFGPGVRTTVGVSSAVGATGQSNSITNLLVLSTLSDVINGGKFFGEATPNISTTVSYEPDSTLEKIGRVTLTVSKDQSWVGSVLNASSTVGTVGVQPGLVYTPVADANVSINMSTQKGYVATAVLGYDLAVAVGVQVQYLHGEQASSIGKLLLPVTKVVTSSGSANQQSVSILGHTVSIINRFPLGTFPADPRRFIAIAQDASLLVLDDDGNLEYVAKDYEIILDGESFIINIK